MKVKKVASIILAIAMTVSLFSGCGSNTKTAGAEAGGAGAVGQAGQTADPQEPETRTKEGETESEQVQGSKDGKPEGAASYEAYDAIDPESLRGSSITVYTHMGQRVLGEEKKDASGNTYRDENTAILSHLAKEFEAQYGITVNFEIAQTEADIEPLLQVNDEAVDVYTNPNWSIEKWQAYAEPYFTLEEGKALYGDYAGVMPNDGEYVYAVSVAKAYDNAVVYNEEVLKAAGYDEIPGTLDEFNTMCEKIKTAGVTPISLHRVENWPLDTLKGFANYVAGSNDAFDAMLKSDTPFNETEPIGKTIKMYTQWKAKGFFEPEIYTDFGVAMDSVAYGKAGMMLFGAWVVPQVQGRVPEGTDPSIIKFAPAPDFGNGRLVTSVPAEGFAIGKGSDNKEAARLFIEYIAENPQFLADGGSIANKAGVKPIVPELYQVIDEAIEAGEASPILSAPSSQNKIHNEEVLGEANLLADAKWAGNLFDSLDITRPDDWSAYEKQVEKQNSAYAEAKEYLDYGWE